MNPVMRTTTSRRTTGGETSTSTANYSHASIRNIVIFLGIIGLSVISIVLSQDSIHGYLNQFRDVKDVYGYTTQAEKEYYAEVQNAKREYYEGKQDNEGDGDGDGGDKDEGEGEGAVDKNNGKDDDVDEDKEVIRKEDGNAGMDSEAKGNGEKKSSSTTAGEIKGDKEEGEIDENNANGEDEAEDKDEDEDKEVIRKEDGNADMDSEAKGDAPNPQLRLEQDDDKFDNEKNDEYYREMELNRLDNIRATTTQDGRKRMNIIVLYPDDWRHNSIGSENPIIKTPFLDSLAKEGIRFRQNAVTTSICWSSRATLFTGQWASRHQSHKLFCPHFCRESLWNHTWPKILQDDGYYTGHVGKWQYHSANFKRFDWDNFHEGAHWYPRFGQPDIAADDLARDDAIEFLQDRPLNKPFAMTVAFYPPKAVGESKEPGEQWKPKNETKKLYENITIPEPYNMSHAFNLLPDFLKNPGSGAVARFHERFRTDLHYQTAMKNMYALITQVDLACMHIVDEVKRQGLYNNTMIIFTTDNGMFHGSHGLAGKWYPYQESIRVPLIIYDPRMPKDKVGTLDDHFTLNVDLAETILGAAGLEPHERMQGRDISDLYLPNRRKENNDNDESDKNNDDKNNNDHSPTALERKPWRDEFFYEFTFLDEEGYIPSSRAVVQKKWKYIDFYNFNHTQLFDLENDPLEFTDVKADEKNRDILNEMREKMAQYVKDYTEPEEYQLPCERHNETYWLAKNPTDT